VLKKPAGSTGLSGRKPFQMDSNQESDLRVPVNPKSKTLWLESLTVGGILFLLLCNGIAEYEVFFDEHKATPRALRFAAIAAKILPVRFYPVSLRLNQKDEKGLSLEYYRADNLCAIVDRFCQNQLGGDPAWLHHMTKCFISCEIRDRIIFVTLVLHRIRGVESSEHLIYLSGHYLNFLLQDFFSPQIKVKSIPSVTAFLRLMATPFALIIYTGMQQLFHRGVKGNIRENQKIPAVWIELAPKSQIGDQLSEFIATNSGGRTYGIVYYLDRIDTPCIPGTTKALEDLGFGWIDTHRMLHARLFVSDYLRLLAGFIALLRQRPFWVALYLFHFEVRRALYLSLYKRFNVRLLLQHQENWLQEAQKQAIESAGGIMVGYHWSNYLNIQYPDQLNPQHVVLVWGGANREYLLSKGNTWQQIIPCGLWVAGSGAKKEDIIPPHKGNFTIAIFDSSVGYYLYQSAENLSKFYLEILSILEDNSSFSGIIKSKSFHLADLRHLPSGEEIVSQITSLEQQGRLRVLDRKRYSPVDAAQAADLSVCFGLNSAGIIAGLLGLKAIHWDCTGWLKYPVYQDKDQKVLFATLSELRQAVMRAAAGDKTIGAFNKWRKQLNHFDDCAGRERILRFIDLYMEGTAGGIVGLSSTVKQYLSEQVGAVEFYEPRKRWWKV
jgi:hypothetical protein